MLDGSKEILIARGFKKHIDRYVLLVSGKGSVEYDPLDDMVYIWSGLGGPYDHGYPIQINNEHELTKMLDGLQV